MWLLTQNGRQPSGNAALFRIGVVSWQLCPWSLLFLEEFQNFLTSHLATRRRFSWFLSSIKMFLRGKLMSPVVYLCCCFVPHICRYRGFLHGPKQMRTRLPCWLYVWLAGRGRDFSGNRNSEFPPAVSRVWSHRVELQLLFMETTCGWFCCTFSLVKTSVCFSLHSQQDVFVKLVKVKILLIRWWWRWLAGVESLQYLNGVLLVLNWQMQQSQWLQLLFTNVLHHSWEYWRKYCTKTSTPRSQKFICGSVVTATVGMLKYNMRKQKCSNWSDQNITVDLEIVQKMHVNSLHVTHNCNHDDIQLISDYCGHRIPKLNIFKRSEYLKWITDNSWFWVQVGRSGRAQMAPRVFVLKYTYYQK